MANLRASNLTGTGGRNAIDGSVHFAGTGDYLSISPEANFELGSGDFTVEGWFYFGNTGSSGTTFWGKWNAPNRSYTFSYVKSTGTYTFGYSTDGSAEVLLTSASLSADINTWVHFAAVRNGSSLKVYRNGISIIDASVGSATFYNATTDLYIGRLQSNTNYDYKGYVSNFRLVKGTALYTANFTPPTEKLTAVDGTVVLCCQDSDDPTQEATGKTITGYGTLQESNDIELVTNSGFTSDISGWTTSGIQWTHSGGGLMHYGNGNTQRNAYQNVTTVVGKRYVARVLASSAEANTAYWQIAGETINYVADNNNSAQLEYRYYFTADSTSTQIRFYSYDSGNSSNVRSYWYLASIKLAPQGEAPKVLPPVGVDEGVVFDGDTKVNTQGHMYFPTGDTSQRGRGRAVIWMGIADSSHNYTKNIDYIEIQTLGNSTRFGEISDTVGLGAAISSSTRGVMAGGTKPGAGGGNQNFIEYITIATTGDAIDFGGVSTTFRYGAGISNQTRGLIAGAYQGSGASGTLNTIQYITIANLGDTVDFGDMVADGGTGIQGAGATSSSTRGITFGGGTPTTINEMNYITIGTLGNSVDFGDLSAARYLCQGVSDGTRGVVAGGDNSGAVNIIEYITIAATGNATDFGDLSSASEHAGGTGGSNKIRGVFLGRGDWPAVDNAMSYITIASAGNAKDFGDIRTGIENYGSNALSDSHGGLS